MKQFVKKKMNVGVTKACLKVSYFDFRFKFHWIVANSIQFHTYDLKGSKFFSSEFCPNLVLKGTLHNVTFSLDSLLYTTVFYF